MQSPNPLLAPPFFVIPGINPEDPISAQMEQIDQFNTILLQDIDHNFARFHQVVTTKLLPEIKRFALASEPTREASKFWKSFFEAAAAVKVPVPGMDTTLTSPTPSRTANHPQQYDDDLDHETSLCSDDRSFLFGVDAVGSTPRGVRTQRASEAGSWMSGDGASVESPFDRLDRKLRDDLKIDQEDAGEDAGTPSLPSGYEYGRRAAQGEYEEEPSVLLSKEEREAYGATDSPDGPRIRNNATPKPGKASRSPHQTRSNPHPSQNPFGHSSATPGIGRVVPPGGWDGIADLRKTPLNPRIKKISADPGPSSAHRRPDLTARSFLDDDSEDEELDRQLEALSPPVTMNFTLPLRNLAKTPAKEAARLVIGDLMKEMGVDSPGIDTPEAFKRYGGDTSVAIESRAGEGRGSERSGKNLFAAVSREQQDNSAHAPQSVEDDGDEEVGKPPRNQLNDLTFDDDTYEAPVTQTTDTFEQSMLRRQGLGTGTQPQQDLTADLIGLSPASEAGRVFGAGLGAGKGPGGFNLMGPDEMQTFHGGRLEDAGTSVIESPSYGLGKSMRRKEDRS